MPRLGVPIVSCVIGEAAPEGRHRDCGRRPGAHAGERDLQRHLAGGLRRDPLAGRRRGDKGGCGVQAGRPSLPRAGRDRRGRPGAGGRRPRTTTRRRGCSARRSPRRSRSWRRCRDELTAPPGALPRPRRVSPSKSAQRNSCSTESTAFSPGPFARISKAEQDSRPGRARPRARSPSGGESNLAHVCNRHRSGRPQTSAFPAAASGGSHLWPALDLARNDLVRPRQRPGADVHGDQSKELKFHFLHKDDLSPIGYDKVRKDTGEHVDPTTSSAASRSRRASTSRSRTRTSTGSTSS